MNVPTHSFSGTSLNGEKLRVVNYFHSGIYHSPSTVATEFQKLRHFHFSSDELLMILSRIRELMDSSSIPEKIKYSFQGPDAFDRWFNKVYEHSGEFRSFFVERAFEQFSRLSCRPQDRFMDIYYDRLNFSFMRPGSLAYQLSAHAKLGISPPDHFLRGWVEETSRKIRDFSVREFSTCIRSFSVLSVLKDNPAYRDMTALFLDQLKDTHLSDIQISQVNAAALRFGFDDHIRNSAPGLENNSETENWTRNVFNTVAGLKLAEAADHFIPALAREVDIRLTTEQGRDVIVEVDGPYHFINNTESFEEDFDGSTKLQTRLLEKLHPDTVIVRLAHHHCRAALRQKMDLANDLNEEFDSVSPGAYQVKLAEGKFHLVPFFT